MGRERTVKSDMNLQEIRQMIREEVAEGVRNALQNKAIQSDWISVPEAANRAELSTATIRRYVDRGILEDNNLSGHQRRISVKSLRASGLI